MLLGGLKAFVVSRDGSSLDEETVKEYVKHNLARYKVPKTVVFGSLPKTSTGKIQKFMLREQARDLK